MIRPAEIPALVTPRLELSAALHGDAAELFAVFSDPEVMRYWSTPALTSMEQVEAIVTRGQNHFAEGAGLLWAVRRRDARHAIGTVSLHRLDDQNSRGEIGYCLGRAAWGQGFMQEALAAVIGYAFDSMDLGRLEADTDPRNAPSIRLLERLGFRREGLLRERWIVAGEITDSAMFGLLRREWRPAAVPPGATTPPGR